MLDLSKEYRAKYDVALVGVELEKLGKPANNKDLNHYNKVFFVECED